MVQFSHNAADNAVPVFNHVIILYLVFTISKQASKWVSNFFIHTWEVLWTWRASIPLATHQFPRLPHIFSAFCPVLSLLLLWTVLLGPHQDLWLCNLLSDGWHEQPLNEVVEALAPNILVQFLSLPHHGTGLHNTLSTWIELNWTDFIEHTCSLDGAELLNKLYNNTMIQTIKSD